MGKHAKLVSKGPGVAKLQGIVAQLQINPVVKVGLLAGGDSRPGVTKVKKGTITERTSWYAATKKKGVVKSVTHGVGASSVGNVELGIIHEFGSPKRGIPARYWLSGPADYHRHEWLALMAKVLQMAIDEKVSVQNALEIVGQRASADVKKGILGGIGLFPPNSEKTIKAKGSSRPLVDTRQMVNSISYAVGGDLGHHGSVQLGSLNVTGGRGGGGHH